eukprot:467984_1
MSALYFSLSLMIILFFYSVSSYWLSENKFNWKNAEKYCQSRCNSHLASIHTNTEWQQVHNLMKYRIQYIGPQIGDVWIGLNRSREDTDIWEWTDDSPFNFGNDTSGGVYPWDSRGEPGDVEICVHIRSYTPFVWNDRDCGDKCRFLCTSCTGKLDKYILNQQSVNYDTALASCETEFGTSLASVHNDDDHDSSTTLVAIHDEEDAWIGLNAIGNTDWHWTDDTPFDYGDTLYANPWKDTEPSGGSEECVRISITKLWYDMLCSNPFWFVCQKPSELCYHDQWTVFDGNALSGGCSVQMNGNQTVVLSSKRWNDAHWPLFIEYTFAIQSIVSVDAQVGIILLQNEDVCDGLFIGIDVDDIPNVISNRFYRFKIELDFDFNETLIIWTGSVDDVIILSGSFPKTNTYRYLGIQNKRTNLMAKTFYISGDAEYQFNETLYECTDDPTLHPSNVPSNQPTNKPSNVPTMHTVNPTESPSNVPSTHPSDVPSTQPSNFPSDFPSVAPFIANTAETTTDATVSEHGKANEPWMDYAVAVVIVLVCLIICCIFGISFLTRQLKKTKIITQKGHMNSMDAINETIGQNVQNVDEVKQSGDRNEGIIVDPEGDDQLEFVVEGDGSDDECGGAMTSGMVSDVNKTAGNDVEMVPDGDFIVQSDESDDSNGEVINTGYTIEGDE